ncbi:MAG: hypothetical protein WDN72_07185 [Alphaproteobacteria bacterium]
MQQRLDLFRRLKVELEAGAEDERRATDVRPAQPGDTTSDVLVLAGAEVIIVAAERRRAGAQPVARDLPGGDDVDVAVARDAELRQYLDGTRSGTGGIGEENDAPALRMQPFDGRRDAGVKRTAVMHHAQRSTRNPSYSLRISVSSWPMHLHVIFTIGDPKEL